MDALQAICDKIMAGVLATPEPTSEEVARAEQRARQERNERLREAWRNLTGPMGARYSDCTLDNYRTASKAQEAVLAEVRQYAAEIRQRVKCGQGVVLFGPSGTGKDHLLVGLCRAALAADIRVRWANGSTLFRSLREGIGEQEDAIVERHIFADVLYLSDPVPPVGGLTPFQASALFAIVDGRYRAQRPTWCSMNVKDGNEAAQRLGSAIHDRLRDGAIALKCSWPSYRKGSE